MLDSYLGKFDNDGRFGRAGAVVSRDGSGRRWKPPIRPLAVNRTAKYGRER